MILIISQQTTFTLNRTAPKTGIYISLSPFLKPKYKDICVSVCKDGLVPRNVFKLELVTHTVFPFQFLKLYL